MTGRHTFLCLSGLCVLFFCAFAASSASAGTGTTAVTCKKAVGNKDFSKAHCKPTDRVTNGTGEYGHEQIANGAATAITGNNSSLGFGTNETIPAILTAAVGANTFEIKCTTVNSTGTFTNSEPTSTNHTVTGTEIEVKYTGCTAPKPAVQHCAVATGTITTNKLSSMDEGMAIKFTPPAGTSFTNITLEGCLTPALNGKKEVTGSVLATPDGATLSVNTEDKEPTTLFFGGFPAGLKLTETVKMEGGEPISVTTTGEAKEEGFAAAEYPATLSGNQAVQHALSVGTKEIECTEASFPGTLSVLSTTVTITPEYKSCRTDLGLPVTATMNGCSYVFHSTGKTSVSCPAGKKIQYHVFESEKKHLANEALCTYSIPTQGPLSGITYEKEGSGSTADLLIKYKLTSLTYEVEGPKAQCGSSGTNGEYTGSTTEIAKNGKGEQIELTLK